MTRDKLWEIALREDNTLIKNALTYARENKLSWEHTLEILVEMLINENDALRNRLKDYDWALERCSKGLDWEI